MPPCNQENTSKKKHLQGLKKHKIGVIFASRSGRIIGTFIEVSQKKMQEKETVKEITENKKKGLRINKKAFLIATAAVLVAALTAVGVCKYMTLYPYAITSKDNVVCYVENKQAASEAVKKAIKELTEKNPDVRIISVGDGLKVERADSIKVSEKIVSSE